MVSGTNRRSSSSICRALFPGSFKPPHRGHFQSVQELLAYPEVDEVVVIISNRCRILPQTRLAIDAETARAIWHLYVAEFPRVRVEVAEHTAVEHALEYLNRSDAGEKLLYCIGQSDLTAGDDRFAEIDRLSRETGASASIVTTETGTRSTELREFLTAGTAGRRDFFTRLPDHLSDHDREAVWQLCQAGARPVDEIVRDKIAGVLRARNFEIRGALRGLDTESVDPSFSVTTSDGAELIIKYAGDTVGSGNYTGSFSRKPRQRLAVERRVLKHLSACASQEFKLPHVVFFDKRTRTLALTRVCRDGISMAARLDRMISDPRTAKRIGKFLAELHSLPLPENPF